MTERRTPGETVFAVLFFGFWAAVIIGPLAYAIYLPQLGGRFGHYLFYAGIWIAGILLVVGAAAYAVWAVRRFLRKRRG